MGVPLVILAGMVAVAVALYMRPHPDTVSRVAAPTPPVPAPVASQQPLPAAGPAKLSVRREAEAPVRALLTQGAEAVERGAFGEAAGLLRQATELAPSDPDAWNGLGVALVHLGDVTAGVAALRRAVRLKPTHSEAERNLGVVLDRQGKSMEAAAHYRAFLDLATNGHPARNDVRRRLGEIASRKGDG